MLKVILSKSYHEAIKILESQPGPWVTIETEYGNKVVSGEISLNHHGDLQHNDPPAMAFKKKFNKRYDNFIVSHIDLDVLFGILWTAGWLKYNEINIQISSLVCSADINGFHTIQPELDRLPDNIRESITQRYFAIGYLVNSWVINDDGKTVKDISREVHKLLLRVKDILVDGATPQQVHKYEVWFSEQEKAAKQHLLEVKPLEGPDNLFIFQAPFSLTTAYTLGNIKAAIIVQYNEQAKCITLSCYDEIIAERYFGSRGVISPLQKYFGKDAGGKMTIGGTSRSHDTQPEMMPGFVEFLSREYFNIPLIEEIPSPEFTSSVISVTADVLSLRFSDFKDLKSIIGNKDA